MSSPTLRLAWLYPDLMNIYGDRGNVVVLIDRARRRGIEVELMEAGLGAAPGLELANLFFFGGGQDKDEELVFKDLTARKKKPIEEALSRGAALLAVCGGYQLAGTYYRTAEGTKLPGLGLLDAWTEAGSHRCIGDVVLETAPQLRLTPPTLVGFENHIGRTFLGPAAAPIGQVRAGFGNNAEDGGEGAMQGNLFGTYLHGSLLPKNPHLADLLLERALGRELPPLEAELELRTHHQ
ncbi:MAG: glutamine amidotransferase, partial [Candidatus Dormibacteraeota bacterium]|nr:glutamine amidotransferase [Candidatus Dormibacteraeota bacterium]